MASTVVRKTDVVFPALPEGEEVKVRGRGFRQTVGRSGSEPTDVPLVVPSVP